MKQLCLLVAALALLPSVVFGHESTPACARHLTAGPSEPAFDVGAMVRRLPRAGTLPEADRAALCATVVSRVENERLVERDGAAVADLLRLVCANDFRALRRVVQSALTIADELPLDAYAEIIDGRRNSTRDARAVRTRQFLRHVIRLDLLNGRDWFKILGDAPAPHVLPVIDAMALTSGLVTRRAAPRQAWLTCLDLREGERLHLGARLLAEQLPFAAVQRWTEINRPEAWARFGDVLTPLQWLGFMRWIGADQTAVASEFEARVARFADPKAPRGEIRTPVVDLIADEKVPVAQVARVVAALKDRWAEWYGDLPPLPKMNARIRGRTTRARLEWFYESGVVAPRAYRRESRAAAREFAEREPSLRRRARSINELRREMEEPFIEVPPHPDDRGLVYATILRILRGELPRVREPGAWVHLAETAVPVGYEETFKKFIDQHLPDLIRTGDAKLEYLDHVKFTRSYLDPFAPTNPHSILHWLRELRDSMPAAARSESSLNQRALEHLYAADADVDRQVSSVYGDVATRRALVQFARRPMLEYLYGRGLAGVRFKVPAADWSKFNAVVTASGYRVSVAHVDSLGASFVSLERSN